MVVIKEQGHLVLPLVSLIGLMFAGFTPLYAAVISIFVTIGASWLSKDTRMGPAKILEAVVEGRKVRSRSACAASSSVSSSVPSL